MLQLRDGARSIPFHRPVPLTPLPLIRDREHVYPYTSYGDTEAMPIERSWRMATLENEALRVEVAPELGGRVYSLYDKRAGKEVLFSNPVVKPVRVLPVWGFISGGIEFNFPIAHSPTSIAEVGCALGRVGDYAYIRVGEREARTGMEWVVELGLQEDRPLLIQRTALRNRTGSAHPWMSWTICAMRSTTRTEFVHPPHRVMVHNDRVFESAWPGAGLEREVQYRQMTGLFWKPGSAPHFGVFHHDEGIGLMHVADPQAVPGKKVWTYGHGRHRAWGQGTTAGGISYCEFESSPLLDQTEKPLFPAGMERRFEEFWLPVHSRTDCDRVELPRLQLPPLVEPWLGWRHSAWQSEWERFRAEDGPVPASPVPTGLELEEPLRRAGEGGSAPAAEALALWLDARDRPAEAIEVLARQDAPSASARRILGLLRWKTLGDPATAVADLEAGPLQDPVAVVELDALYAELGMLHRRLELLPRAPAHRRVIERRADLALATGNPAEALRLLASTPWPREHQRYVRTELWKRACLALGEPDKPVPDVLGEDPLASFGAYWSES